MSRAPFQLALINGAPDRSESNIGSVQLDESPREEVSQAARRRKAATTDGKGVAG